MNSNSGVNLSIYKYWNQVMMPSCDKLGAPFLYKIMSQVNTVPKYCQNTYLLNNYYILHHEVLQGMVKK